MKIAMIGHKRIPSREGGVEIVVEELSKRMVQKGHEVVCYNRRGKHALDKNQKVEKIKEYKGIKIKEVLTIDKKGLAAMTSSFFGTVKILFSKYDVVHFHAEGPCVMIPIIKLFSQKKVIATIHGLDWQRAKWKNSFASKYIKFGEKMAAKYADEIIVLSKNVQNYFEKNYKRNTNFIPNGVSEPKILKPNIITNKYGLKKDEYFLFLGRIVPEKGIHYLIEAFNQIKTQKKLVIAGGASDTNEYYMQLKKKSSNNKNIIFTNFVQGNELEELYSNAYIYVLPSDLEGMPLSLLEAMSYGNCCLTSDIEECSSVIKNNGITFHKSDINDLKNKLQYLDDNKSQVNKHKKNSKNYILNNYDWDVVTDLTLDLYSKRR